MISIARTQKHQFIANNFADVYKNTSDSNLLKCSRKKIVDVQENKNQLLNFERKEDATFLQSQSYRQRNTRPTQRQRERSKQKKNGATERYFSHLNQNHIENMFEIFSDMGTNDASKKNATEENAINFRLNADVHEIVTINK